MQYKNTLTILSLAGLMALASCNTDEIAPDINFSDYQAKDTTYVLTQVPPAEEKHVLVEESTGVKCPNCPKGTQVLKDLDATYNDRLEIVSIHYGGQTLNDPHPLKPELDLRPDAAIGDAYIALLGGSKPQPAASIDRQEYDGELLNNRISWANQVSARIAIPTPVNIELSASQDPGEMQLQLDMKLTYTQDLRTDDDHYYSIILLENDIEGVQDSVGYDIEDYIFEDVFRGFVTAVSGERITADREAGRVIEKSFLIPYDELGKDWNKANLVAIVLVHKNQSTDLSVLQSKEVHF